jgi:hypothetical protein
MCRIPLSNAQVNSAHKIDIEEIVACTVIYVGEGF